MVDNNADKWDVQSIWLDYHEHDNEQPVASLSQDSVCRCSETFFGRVSPMPPRYFEMVRKNHQRRIEPNGIEEDELREEREAGGVFYSRRGAVATQEDYADEWWSVATKSLGGNSVPSINPTNVNP